MAVSGGSGESVMIVVPRFSLREYRPEPRIAAAVTCLVSAISVLVADRVDDEGAMPAVGGSETSAPQEQRQAEFWPIEAIPDEVEQQKNEPPISQLCLSRNASTGSFETSLAMRCFTSDRSENTNTVQPRCAQKRE